MSYIRIIEDILKMPYYKNYSAVSGAVHNIAKHEKAVEDLFINHGLTKSHIKKLTKKKRNAWLNGGDHTEMSDNTYISQPCGKNDSPDFIVKCDGKLYFFECKSSKGTSPTYNSNYAKEGYIYIFTSEKYDATTVFMGEDIVNDESVELYEALKKAHEVVTKKYVQLLKITDKNNRGLNYYNREMYTQKGSNTDYFTHQDRDRCESNVLNYKGTSTWSMFSIAA